MFFWHIFFHGQTYKRVRLTKRLDNSTLIKVGTKARKKYEEFKLIFLKHILGLVIFTNVID